MKNSIQFLTATGICLVFAAVSCSQKDQIEWYGWRGPNRDGKVTAFEVPAQWPEELTKVWQMAVGLSNSSPVISGNNIFLHVRQDSSEVAICIDQETGNQVWRTVLNPAPEVTGGARSHPGPRSTPAVSGGKVFMLGTGGVFTCLDAETGKILWQVDQYTEVPQFYAAASPLVDGNKCFIHLGGHENGAIIAFDTDTGEEAWKIGGEPSTYSSPVMMNFEGKKILVVQTETDVLGLTTDGKELFKIPTPTERRFYNSTTPVINGNTIIICGQGTGTHAYQIEKKGEKYSWKEVWNNPGFGGSFNTPVLNNGYLYGNEARLGKLYCLNAQTGATCWADTIAHNRFASTLNLGDVILTLPATGNLIVYQPNPEKYQPVKIYKIAETEVYAHPLLSENKIFVKDENFLTCWSVK